MDSVSANTSAFGWRFHKNVESHDRDRRKPRRDSNRLSYEDKPKPLPLHEHVRHLLFLN